MVGYTRVSSGFYLATDTPLFRITSSNPSGDFSDCVRVSLLSNNGQIGANSIWQARASSMDLYVPLKNRQMIFHVYIDNHKFSGGETSCTSLLNDDIQFKLEGESQMNVVGQFPSTSAADGIIFTSQAYATTTNMSDYNLNFGVMVLVYLFVISIGLSFWYHRKK